MHDLVRIGPGRHHVRAAGQREALLEPALDVDGVHRRLPDHVRLLPVTALSGAIFLMGADTLARSMFAPSEVPVGILMAFLGGPFFLYLLRKSKRSYAL